MTHVLSADNTRMIQHQKHWLEVGMGVEAVTAACLSLEHFYHLLPCSIYCTAVVCLEEEGPFWCHWRPENYTVVINRAMYVWLGEFFSFFKIMYSFISLKMDRSYAISQKKKQKEKSKNKNLRERERKINQRQPGTVLEKQWWTACKTS